MSRPSTPRLTSVMGVARALLATVDPREGVEVLIAEFGWDMTFQALVLLTGDEALEGLGHAWEHLLTGPIEHELREVRHGDHWLGEA